MTDTTDREILLTRVFAAPPDAVFTAWTDPQAVGQWWGPQGFTITTESMTVAPGGRWIYTMHGPDGTDYPNWIRYRSVERPRRLVYEHGGGGDHAAVHFEVTVDFEALGNGTRVTMRSVFPTAEARDAVVQRYGAIEGGKQHLACLGEYLATRPVSGADRARAVVTRTFAYPRSRVWQAWTDPQHLAAWWGPADFTNPRCQFEARLGGAIAIDMRGPDGVVHPMCGTVVQIEPEERLAFFAEPLDEQGQALFAVLNTIDLREVDGGTQVVVTTDVLAMTPGGVVPREGMAVGWRQSLDRLDDLLGDPEGARDPAREVVTTRVFPVPREQVFAAWTDPALLARWWGPEGFTNTFHAFDLRPGGDWRFTMHGPDGTDYHNHSVFREIAAPERLRFEHLGPMHRFQVHASFFPWEGGTLVRFRMRFDTVAECERVRGFIAPANEQNFDRLAALLTTTA